MTALLNSGIPLSLPPASIIIPPDGLRRVATTPEQDAGLMGSIQVLGVLQPIIVRAHPADRALWLLVAGRRRLLAAQAAGLSTIPAIDRADLTDAGATAIEAAENMQRAAMAPVDQWRAIGRMTDAGWTLDSAAEALGLSQRLASRLQKLSQLHPDVLAAIETHGMPEYDRLAEIASAPLDVQAAAIRREAKDAQPAWWRVAAGCRTTRIMKGRAIFDTDLAGVAWDEDLFAEPGSPAQFTTADIEGFMEAQRAALLKLAEDSRGKLSVATRMKHGSAEVPKGMEQVHTWHFGDAKMPRGITGLVWVREDGSIGSTAIRPIPKTKAKAPAPAPQDEGEGEEDGAGPDDAEPEPTAPPPPAPKPCLTQAGRELLAELRTDGLRAALRDRPLPARADHVALLLLALSASNVVVSGERGNKYGRTSFRDIAAATFAAMSEPDAYRRTARLDRLAQEAVARILICNGTKAANGSGDAAEWIGELVEADATLPRLDRAELLAAMSGDLLSEIAAGAGHKPGKVAGMRQALTDAVPDLRLPEARFHAPRPELEPEPDCDRAAGADACRCGWKVSDGAVADPCALGEWKAMMARLGLMQPPAQPAASAPPAEISAPPAPAPPPAAAAPLPAHACPWDGSSQCPDDLKRSCTHECPRREEYDRWWESPAADQATRSPQERAAAEIAKATPAAHAEPPAPNCGWNGENLCKEEGTTVCHRLCPLHAKYAEWVNTTKGKAARRRAENTEARESLRRTRKVAP